MFEYRLVFDTIPEEFEKSRPTYCPEAFDDIIRTADLRPGRKVLEIGPGTGQATTQLLDSGCELTGIELGEHLYRFLLQKYAGRPNAHFVNGDYCTYDFGTEKFDMVFSAATIQWIPEQIAFTRAFDLLKPGGSLVMIANISNDAVRNPPELLEAKSKVYDTYFHPETMYNCHINKQNVTEYGFLAPESVDYTYDADMTADEFVALTMTNADHILLKDPERTLFMNGLRDAVNKYGGGLWRRHDRVNIVRAIKPE